MKFKKSHITIKAMFYTIVGIPFLYFQTYVYFERTWYGYAESPWGIHLHFRLWHFILGLHNGKTPPRK